MLITLKTDKIRAFFVKNVGRISAKPLAFRQNLPTKFPRNLHFFFREFVYENPAKFDPFTATDQKLCPILSPIRPLESPFHHELTPVFSCRAGPSSYTGALTSCRKNIQEGRSRKHKIQEAIPS